ncbi:MAG: RagB/SusD family nutrient uptake outer membrane protein [Bacteroidaceae bacterium]|nr:RagB/SusD family nutrient uptake outer membrane protein [Bacteroidaceae bacterium]
MKKNLIYGLIAGAALTFGLSSCNNDEFLDVTHYSMLEGDQMFANDDNAIKGMTGCYDLLHRRGGKNDDPYKYWIFNGLHPTMDSQASGWDKDFMTQNWTAKNEQLRDYWKQSYACASRCNDFLAGLEASENISKDVKDHLRGEAMALRGFQFFGLANTFGRVPLLITGENYVNTPVKAKAKDYAEMWDFVIKDFKEAATLLDWQPFQGQYGRCTKGMALTFLGDAYMWKAYTCPEKADSCYLAAYNALKEVYDSHTYKLSPSFSTLYDAEEAWPDEAIWQIVLNSGDDWGSWDDTKNAGARGWTGFYFGPTSNGAWGTFQMSWELYDSFENYLEGEYAGSFDKRRDASMVTATIPAKHIVKPEWEQRVKPTQAWIDANKKYIRGYKEVKKTDADGNEITEYEFDQATYDAYDWNAEADNGKYDPQHPMGFNPFNQEYVGWCGYHWSSADPAPTVWSSKHWRNGRGTDWGTNALWTPDHIYFKRLANVYLDLAECCFRLGGDKVAFGWQLVNEIRKRAFGNMEVGQDLSKYIAHHNKVYEYYKNFSNGDCDGKGAIQPVKEYPFPFNTEVVNVPDAQTYYADLKAKMGYESEVWKIAVNNERRKEFSAEPYLRSDMHKSGFLKDHVEHVYKKNSLPTVGLETITQWETARDFDFKMEKMFMPIPEDEILKNPACEQNEGY